MMKRTPGIVGTWILTLLVGVAVSACAPRSGTTETASAVPDASTLPVGATPGKRAPSISLVDADGQAVELSGLEGEVVLLNFWAPWCVPCIEEMPSLQKLHEELEPAGLNVIAAGLDTTPAAAKVFTSEMGLTFDIWIDSSHAAARSFRVRAIPMTFLIDRRGVVRTRYSGAREWNDADLVAQMRNVLEEGKP